MRFLLLLVPRTIMYFWYLRQVNKWDRKSDKVLQTLAHDLRFRNGKSKSAYESIAYGPMVVFRLTLRKVNLSPNLKVHYWKQMYVFALRLQELVVLFTEHARANDVVTRLDSSLYSDLVSQEDKKRVAAIRKRRQEECWTLLSQAEKIKSQLATDLILAAEEIEERAETKSCKLSSDLSVPDADRKHLKAAEQEIEAFLQRQR